MRGFIQVQYVGQHGPRMDNVNPRSGRVWEKPGSVLNIPEAEAWQYLAYPGVWKRVGFSVVQDAMVTEANSPETVDLLCGSLSLLTNENLQRVIQAATEMLTVPEEDPSPPVDLNDPQAVAAYNARIKKVLQAIQAMPENSDNFDPASKKPRLAAVQKYAKVKGITQEEVDAALLLKKPF